MNITIINYQRVTWWTMKLYKIVWECILVYEIMWFSFWDKKLHVMLHVHHCITFEVKPTIFADARSWNAVGCPEARIQQQFGYFVNLSISLIWDQDESGIFWVYISCYWATWAIIWRTCMEEKVNRTCMDNPPTYRIHPYTIIIHYIYTTYFDTRHLGIFCRYHKSRLSIPIMVG